MAHWHHVSASNMSSTTSLLILNLLFIPILNLHYLEAHMRPHPMGTHRFPCSSSPQNTPAPDKPSLQRATARGPISDIRAHRSAVGWCGSRYFLGREEVGWWSIAAVGRGGDRAWVDVVGIGMWRWWCRRGERGKGRKVRGALCMRAWIWMYESTIKVRNVEDWEN